MFLDKKITYDKLSALWADPQVPSLETKNQKIAILSDLHFGNGGEADDFFNNRNALVQALEHYGSQGYKLILLGDIEEFWQFTLEDIVRRYEQLIYEKFRKFGEQRILRVFGNHDGEWAGLSDPTKGGSAKGVLASEAVKLKDAAGQARLLLVHGHQGTIDSDKFSWFSRFFVRLFRGIEPLARLTGLYSNPAATKSMIAKDFERTLYEWARQNKVILVCGHTHRAIFASKSYAEKLHQDIAGLRAENSLSRTPKEKRRENLQKIDELERKLEDEKEKGRVIEPTDPAGDPLPCYFNTGCGVYSDGMTAIEIEDDEMRLVKWDRNTFKPSNFEVYNRGSLSEIVKKVIA